MNPIVYLGLLEIIGINLYTTYSCSKRKWSPPVTILLLCTITAAITALLFPLVTNLPGFGNGNGNGIFMLFGLCYILPVKFLFDQPLKQTAIVMFSADIYTMFVFSLSCRISFHHSLKVTGLTFVIIQTLIFIVTLPLYIRIIKKELNYILKSVQQKMINYILIISISSFLVIFLINYIFVEGSSALPEFSLLTFIILGAILSYRLAYQLVMMHQEANDLSRITKIDSMTKLKNRKGLYEDVNVLVEKESPFAIIYIDLDYFKAVNDSFGHAIGDAYLLEFVKAAELVMKGSEHFYRLHGDEFVVISDIPQTKALCYTLENLKFSDNSGEMKFRGASTGCAFFPVDGDTLNDLLYMADLNMYTNKKERHTSIDTTDDLITPTDTDSSLPE